LEVNMSINKDRLVKLAKGYVDFFEREGEEFISPAAFVLLPDGSTAAVMMPDLDIARQRVMLEQFTEARGVTELVVINELWVGCASTPADGALLLQLGIQGRLQDAPKELLEERVQIIYEGRDIPIEAISTPVIREEGKRTLGEWRTDGVKLPYPGFRRYFKHVEEPMGDRTAAMHSNRFR
jgi:hypothetical protein